MTQTENIINYYQNNYSCRRISSILNINRKVVSSTLKINNVLVKRNDNYRLIDGLNQSIKIVYKQVIKYITNDLFINGKNIYKSFNVLLRLISILYTLNGSAINANQQPSLQHNNLKLKKGSETREMSSYNNNFLHECPKTSKYGRKTYTARILRCKICNELFFKSKEFCLSTCSSTCNNIYQKSNIKKRVYTKFIINKYIASDETRKKLSIAGKISARNRKANGTYRNRKENSITKNTVPELMMQYLLKNRNIDFQAQYKICNENGLFYYDLLIPKKNLLIEIQGDYWHGNPKTFTIFNKYQQQQKIKDEFKKDVAQKLGYKIIYIWENNLRKYHSEVYDIVRTLKKFKEL